MHHGLCKSHNRGVSLICLSEKLCVGSSKEILLIIKSWHTPTFFMTDSSFRSFMLEQVCRHFETRRDEKELVGEKGGSISPLCFSSINILLLFTMPEVPAGVPVSAEPM